VPLSHLSKILTTESVWHGQRCQVLGHAKSESFVKSLIPISKALTPGISVAQLKAVKRAAIYGTAEEAAEKWRF
jgi:hypothetical protein